jgi:hypothetical protein
MSKNRSLASFVVMGLKSGKAGLSVSFQTRRHLRAADSVFFNVIRSKKEKGRRSALCFPDF